MSNNDIMLCVDQSNNFNQIFLTLCREFKARIIQVGLKCEISWGDVETSARKVVFGAHSSPEYWLKKAHTNDIIVNLEPFYKAEWRDKNTNYLKLLQSRCVFEYCLLELTISKRRTFLQTATSIFRFTTNSKKGNRYSIYRI